jgi:site-specific recombinase XerD
MESTMMQTEAALPLNGEIQEFLNYCLDNSKSIVTVTSYGQALNKFSVWLSDAYPDVASITSINLSHLQQFRRHLRLESSAEGREMAISTQAKYLSILRSWLRYAQREAKLPVLDREDVSLPKTRPTRSAQKLRATEVERLLSQPDTSKVWGLRDRAIIAMLLTTGLKVSQLCGLDRRDIREDLLGTTLKLQLHTRSRRGVGITLDERAQQCLMAYLAHRTDSYNPLFIRHKPGKALDRDDAHHRLTRQMVNRMLEKYSRQAGISQLVSPNILRKGGR